jgi:hypothetical protein
MSAFLIFTAFGTLMGYVPWTAIFLFTQLFGVRLYTVNNKEDCVRIRKRVGNCSHMADGDRGYGYSIGRWYIMSISLHNDDEGDRYTIWMVATEATYKRLSADRESAPVSLATDAEMPLLQAMTVYERSGSFQHCYFRKRVIDLPQMKPRTEQADIIRQIQEHFATNKHTVAYLHGPAGTGKSMIGLLLANQYKSSYCNTLKPWQPGDRLVDLHAEAEPTPTKPLIVALDEFDGALFQVHAGIPAHKNLPIAVPDKAGWNHMFDQIQRGMYPNTILILTSNRGPAFIRALDPSYIREGRVDLILEMP